MPNCSEFDKLAKAKLYRLDSWRNEASSSSLELSDGA